MQKIQELESKVAEKRVAEVPPEDKLSEALKRVAELEAQVKSKGKKPAPPEEPDEETSEEDNGKEDPESYITTPDGKVVPYTEITWYKSWPNLGLDDINI